MVKSMVAGVLVPAPFVAVTVTEYEPTVVGVPEITPVDVFKESPGGKVPLAIS